MTFFITWCHWPWSLVLVLHDANGIKIAPLHSLTPRQLKWGATWQFGHLMPLARASVSCNANSIIKGTTPFLRLDNWNEVQHHLVIVQYHLHQHWHYMVPLALVLVSCDATELVSVLCNVDSIVNGTVPFPRVRWSNCDPTYLFWSCDATGTWGWHHGTQFVSVAHDANGIINGTIPFLRSRQLKWGAT